MTWVKIDDQFADHPKFLDLSNAAVGVWVKGLAYCSRYLTDGYVPPAAARRIGATPKLVDELVDGGVWHRANDGFIVHDYTDYHPSAAEVRALREKRAFSGRLGGFARGRQKINPDQGKLDVDPKANGQQLAKHVADPLPSPRPDPTRPLDDFVVSCTPDDDERISKAARALAERVHQREVDAGKVTNKRAHRRTLIANAVDDHGDDVARFFADHPDATIDDAVTHLDPTPSTKEPTMAGANWTVHATYEDADQGFVAALPIICQSEQEAENRAADERARLFSAGKQAIDVAVQPPTHPAG